MKSFEPWAVVRVPFPYADRPIVQRRPALVLACPDAVDGLPVLLVAMITSAAHRRWPNDVVIVDLACAGLPAPSLVRCARITTIDADVVELLGILGDTERGHVRSRLRSILAQVFAEP